MDSGLIFELSEYRLKRARETLSDAKTLFSDGRYESSVNRSYYAIFHALRAVTAFDGFDSSKHSGIIAHFNQSYVKTGIFDKEMSKLIRIAFSAREKADYDDYAEITKEMAESQMLAAEKVVTSIETYLNSKLR